MLTTLPLTELPTFEEVFPDLTERQVRSAIQDGAIQLSDPHADSPSHDHINRIAFFALNARDLQIKVRRNKNGGYLIATGEHQLAAAIIGGHEYIETEILN